MNIRDIYPGRPKDRESTFEVDAAPRAPSAQDASQSLFGILWRRKLVVLATILLFVLGGIGYIAVTPPRYLASTSMLIDPRLGKVVGTDPVQPGYIPDTTAMDSQIKLFVSQTVLARVAKMASLSTDPEFNGSERSLLQRLLHPAPALDDSVDLKTLESAITIKRPERTYVVGIDVLARDPKKAAEIANDLTRAYIEDQVTARVTAARDDTQFVREKLDKLSAEIRDADDKIEAYKTANNIVDANGLRSNEQQVADLMKSLVAAQASASDAKARLDQIDAMARRGRLDASAEAVKSLTIERLRQQQATTEETVAKLAGILGPRHPERVEAEARQAKVQRLISNELERLKIAAKSDYDAAQTNQAQIAAAVDQLKSESATLSAKLVPLDQLERNARVLRSSFERFAQVNDNLAQQEADSPPGRVIAVAQPPVSPAVPKKTLVMLLSAAAGLFFGLAGALLAEGTESRSQRGHPTIYAPEAELAARQPAPRHRPVRRYWDDDE